MGDILAHPPHFKDRETKAQRRKSSDQVGSWLLKNAKGIPQKPNESRKSLIGEEVCLILLKSILAGTRIGRPDSGLLRLLLLRDAIGHLPVPRSLLLADNLTAAPFPRTGLWRLRSVYWEAGEGQLFRL